MNPESPTIRIIEVGPRDGLQSLNAQYSLETRIEWIRRLASAGVAEIECGAFVRPDLVPAMAKSDQLFELLGQTPFRKWALIPNRVGMDRALQSGADALAFFTSATEEFNLRNTGCTRDESLIRFRDLVSEAAGRPLRAYISCCFECPYEGVTDPSEVVEVSLQLQHAGASEIVISDTIGSARPDQVQNVIDQISAKVPLSILALHLHDTQGRAVECAKVAYQCGIRSFDSSAGGLGGCPFAPGASGNVATESLVGLFDSLGIETGINLQSLRETHTWFSAQSPVTP